MTVELPFHLKTLEPLPGALDIIRHLGELEEAVASADELCTALDLSDRAFSKAIRRLVTKGYAQMDGNQMYRLSEQGQDAADELAEYDENAPEDSGDGEKYITRRLIVAVPRVAVANQPNTVYVGFNESDDDRTLAEPASMVLRLSAIHGGVEGDEMFDLTDDVAYQTFTVTPEAFNKVRVRVEVYQINPFDDGIEECGGLYVDVDVANGASDGYVVYGTDVVILPTD